LIFGSLARLVTRRYKLILVLWIVFLVASVPLFTMASKVTSSQELSASGSGESAVAQRIIDSNFSSSAQGEGLFLVITSPNVTATSVRSFVEAFGNQSVSDPALANLTAIGSAYSSVGRVVDGAVSAMGGYRAGAVQTSSILYGVPAAFLSAWAQYGFNQTEISPSAAATSALLSSQITNSSELEIADAYLQAFAAALTGTYQTPAQLNATQRADLAITASAQQLIGQFGTSNPALASMALAVLQGLTLGDYTDPAAIEGFVVSGVSQGSLYTQQFLRAAYPLVQATSPQARADLVEAIIVNPARFDFPSFYLGSVNGFVGSDHRVMLVSLTFSKATDSEVSTLRALVRQQAAQYGLAGDVAVTGTQALSSDFSSSSFQDLGVILPFTVIILIAATGIFFRSVVSPAVTLAGIGIALGIADSLVLYAVGTYVVRVDPNVPNILLTVLIGVGTDYSVFLLARYREERARGAARDEAVARSVTWAGESIATSGATVIISFVFLGLGQSVTLLRSLGLVVGAGVLVALAASLTLVPSIIMAVPNMVFWPNVGARFSRYAARVERSIENKTGYFSRSANFSIKHAKVITVVALVATVPAAYVWYHAPVGYDFLAAAPKNLESVAAFNSMSASFGAGKLYPTYVVLQFTAPLWNGTGYDQQEMSVVDQLSNTTLAQAGVDSVAGPTRPGGVRVSYRSLGSDPRSLLLESSVNKNIGKDARFALLTVDLKESPYGQDSLNTAQALRDAYAALRQSNPSLAGAFLGGAAGSTLDTKGSVNTEFDQVILYVMVGVAVVLLLVLGSLFLPLFALLSIVMSIAWTIAATDIVFQGLYDFPILYITPLTLFALLLGLGMDYNVFILTRIREEATKGVPLKQAITTAIERTGGIITAAALILAGSLGALMLSNNLLLKEFGFAFAYSIIIDAMIMRTYVVPAVMSLMGRWNWYAPGRLQRVRQRDAQ
jgi:putative drug exporter of the RND superfamily